MAVKKYRDNQQSLTSAWDRNGDRRGFVSKDRNSDGSTRYGIGVDKVGSPYRGVLERELNLPIGTLDYGYDGDTVAAGFTPNTPYAGYNSSPNMASAWAGMGDYQLRANRFGDPGQTPSYAIGLNYPDTANIPDYQRSFNTPLGNIGVLTNDGNSNIGATYTPSAYIMALANLLSGR